MEELEEARKWLDELMPAEALEAANKALEVAKGKHKAGHSAALQVVAEAHVLNGDAEGALSFLTEALTLSRGVRNQKLEARVLRTIVSAYLVKGESGDALLIAVEALAIARSLGDKEEEAASLHSLAQVYLVNQGPQEALKVAKEAVAQFHDAKSRHRRGEAKALQAVATASLMEANPKDALQATRRALQLHRELGDLKSEAATWNSIAQACLAWEDVKGPARVLTDHHGPTIAMYMVMNTDAAKDGADVALQATEKALSLCRKSRDVRGEAATLHTVAQIKLAMGRPDEALTASKKTALLFRKLEDKAGEAIALCSVAQVNLSKGDYDECLQNLQEAVDKFTDAQHRDGQLLALSILVDVHIKKKETQKALRTAEQAVELCTKAGDKKGHAMALQTLSAVHVAKDDAFKALQVTQEMLELGQQLRDIQIQLNAFRTLANLYKRRDQVPDAQEAASDARKVADKAETDRRRAQSLMIVFEIYADLNDAQEAFKLVAEAQGLFFKAGDKKGEAAALLIAANMLGTRKEVADVAARAATLLQELGNDLGRANMMHQAAVALVESGDFDKAGLPAGTALRLYKEKGAVDMQAYAIELIAQIHIRQLEKEMASDKPSDVRHAEGHGREGLRLAKEAVELFRKVGDKAGYASSLHTLASANLLTEHPREAIQAAQDAEKLFAELSDKHGEGCAILTQANSFISMRKNEAAESFAERGKALATEIGDEKNQRVADEILALVERGGLGDGQTRRAAFFVQHPDTPYAKQCMELSARLLEMSSTPASGKHLTVLTRGVFSRPRCNPAPAAPGMLAQGTLSGIMEGARTQYPRLKVMSLDMPSGCSMKELGPSIAAAFMPTGYSSTPIAAA